MRVTNQMLMDTVLRSLDRSYRRMQSLQKQIASRKAISKPSDDPSALLSAATARTDISRVSQNLKDIDNARAWLIATESALDSEIGTLERARIIAIQGGSDTLSQDERSCLAAEINEILKQAVDAGNLTHQGRYILSGFKTSTAPFTLVTLAGGEPQAVNYNGDSGQILRQIDPSTTVAVNVTGDSISDVFNSLIDLYNDLVSDDAASIRDNRISQIDDALNTLMDLRAQIGAKSNQLDMTESRLSDMKISLDQLLSKAEDIDIAEAILKLSTQETVYKAALAAAARIIQPSLLNFLS